MERFSMNEFKPLTLEDKILRLESQVVEIKKTKQPLISRKQQLDMELSNLNSKIRKGEYQNGDYNIICDQQDAIRKEKLDIEKKLSELRIEVNKIASEENSVRHQLKKIPNEKAKESLLGLRDKYMSFAADTTRVSSMRAMSSRFVEEIQSILTDMG